MSKDVPENLIEMKMLGEKLGFDLCCYDDYSVMMIVAERLLANESVKWVVVKAGESVHNLMGYSFFSSEEEADDFWKLRLNEYMKDDEDFDEDYEAASEAACLFKVTREMILPELILTPYDIDRDGMNNVLRNWKYEISMEDGLIGPWKWVDADGNLKAEGVGRVAFFEAAVNAEKKDNGVYFIFGDTGAPDGARYSDKAGNYYTRDGERIVG